MIATQASVNRTFHLLSFGCEMNVRDSGWLRAALKKLGFQETDAEQAELVILNTCSVREKPEAKVAATINRLRQAGVARFAVLGCVAEQSGQELLARFPDVILAAGGNALPRVPETLVRLLEQERRECLLGFDGDYPEKEAIAEPLRGGTALVSIMQGCSSFCSYCIVPYTRGPEKRRRFEAILGECESRIAQGASEIVLLGQNVNIWHGENEGRQVDFAWLLQRLCAIPGLKRLRFLTSHPRDLTAGIINCFGELEQLCPSLHLPLQSGSDNMLARMGRGYTGEDYLARIAALKKARPDIALATDIIVGFPGETEADFCQTLSLVEECGFVTSYSFCYSDRPGTAASRMPFKISREASLERLMRLQELQNRLSVAWLGRQVGRETEILIDGRSSRGATWQGRDPYSACVNVDLGEGEAFAGQMVRAVITEAKKHSLLARRVPEVGHPRP